LDKNYGGVLIVWDRLFGTFQEEEQKEKSREKSAQSKIMKTVTRET